MMEGWKGYEGFVTNLCHTSSLAIDVKFDKQYANFVIIDEILYL